MWERLFRLKENGTTVGREIAAGLTTFLTMAYIIFVQPAVLSGSMFNAPTGMDFGAVTTATCLSAALASAIMGLYARYPIAQAPGMGENFFFVFSAIPAAAALLKAHGDASLQPWQVALGVVFLSGVAFLILSLLGVRELLLNSISRSMRNAIAVGIGMFIAFIGLRAAKLIEADPGTLVRLNPRFSSPDVVVFFVGLIVTGALCARRKRGAILWGILAATAAAIGLRYGLPRLAEPGAGLAQFAIADRLFSTPPSIGPTVAKLNLSYALSPSMLPFVLIFLFMLVFDTLGTLVGVAERAGFIRDNQLPRARQAFVSDAVGTVAGSVLGTSTVTSFIESAAGVEQGGRTGLTALTAAVLFLAAPFFSPIVAMIGSYPPITAPALVVVGSLMIGNVVRIEWDNYAEALPAFLVILGIPLSYSIGDGLSLGFIAYPIVKLVGGQRRDVTWLMYLLAAVLVAYFAFVRVLAQ